MDKKQQALLMAVCMSGLLAISIFCTTIVMQDSSRESLPTSSDIATIIVVDVALFIIIVVNIVIFVRHKGNKPLTVCRIALSIYFKSKKFANIKECIKSYIVDCNELNAHIEELKSISAIEKAIDYGMANFIDNSEYNYRRPESGNTQYKNNIYNCSLSVCKNAQQQPFKYLCKYFDVKPTEENLSYFENLLNNFAAAEQGKELLQREHDRIV